MVRLFFNAFIRLQKKLPVCCVCGGGMTHVRGDLKKFGREGEWRHYCPKNVLPMVKHCQPVLF